MLRTHKVLIFIIILVVGSYFLHSQLQISVAPFDIFLLLASILGISTSYRFLSQGIKSTPPFNKNFYSSKNFTFKFSISCFTLLVSFLLLIDGIDNPFGHRETTKVCFAHGYSYFMLGVCSLLCSLSFFMETFYKMEKVNKAADYN